MYGDAYAIAPLSVVVDPVRALRALGIEPGRSFTSKVLYVYRKQLEEAALIVINKCDVVEPGRVAALRAALEREYPRARLFEVSARTGQGLEAWFGVIAEDQLVADAELDIDYQIYGEGEALLGWLNATVRLDGPPFDGNAWLRDLAGRIQAGLDDQQVEIAHLKMTLSPGDEGGDLAVINQVRNEHGAELSHALMDDIDAGHLIVNLRAEGDPAGLAAVVTRALDAAAVARNLTCRVEHEEHFRPGQPKPTHRLAPA
jgi:hypothetical protein